MPNELQFKTHEEYLNWYREYRNKNREKLRLYNREYNKEYRLMNGYRTKEKWKLEHPEEYNAQRLLQYAVRTGLIKREPCEKCGKKKTHGHHPDYSQPLKVVWLCPLCHKQFHERSNQLPKKELSSNNG